MSCNRRGMWRWTSQDPNWAHGSWNSLWCTTISMCRNLQPLYFYNLTKHLKWPFLQPCLWVCIDLQFYCSHRVAFLSVSPESVPVCINHMYYHWWGPGLLAGPHLQVFAGLMKMSLVPLGICHWNSEMAKLLLSWLVFFGVFSFLSMLMLQMPWISATSCIWTHMWVVCAQPLRQHHLSVHCWLSLFVFLTRCMWKHLEYSHATSAPNRPCFLFLHCYTFVRGNPGLLP